MNLFIMFIKNYHISNSLIIIGNVLNVKKIRFVLFSSHGYNPVVDSKDLKKKNNNYII